MVTKKLKWVPNVGRLKDGLHVGMTAAADDGWRGRVENITGESIVCIRAGEQPNDYLRGYRVFKRSLVMIRDGKAVVTTISKRAKAVTEIAKRANARLQREWSSAPD